MTFRTNRKSQIKMFESVAVLVVFFFLIVFGVSFYFVLQRSSMQKATARAAQLKSIQTAQKITFLPELDCTFMKIQIDNCFDAIKLRKFAETLNDSDVKLSYFDTFEYSQITVRKIFPIPEGEQHIFEIYDKPLPKYTSMLPAFIPILIFEPVTDKYSFGVLEVYVYAN